MAIRVSIDEESERQRLLENTLRDLPADLVDAYGGREGALDAALSEAEVSFEEAASEWEDFRAHKARARALTGTAWRRILIEIAGMRNFNRFVWSLLTAGVGLYAYLKVGLPLPREVLSLELTAIGLILLAAPLAVRTLADLFASTSAQQRRSILLEARARSWQWVGLSFVLFGGFLYLLPFLQLRRITVEALALSLIVIGVSAYSAREFFGRPVLDRLELARERRMASRRAFENQLRVSILSRLRTRLSTEDSYSTILSYKDYSGLAEMDDATREVPTATRGDLIRLMELMPGGTIALAGSRGSGKSTLMRSICAAPTTRKKEQEPLAVIVDAPVKYEARDFILHLFARLCSAVVGEDEVRSMRGSDRLLRSPDPTRRPLVEDPQLLVGMFCVLAGLLLTLGTVMGLRVSSPLGLGVILVAGGYLLMLPRFMGGRRRSGTSEADAFGSSSGDPNVHTAVLHLRQIWFQQSFSHGWSGGFKVPVGIEGGLSGSTELSEQQLSLPDIVDLFREFLKQVAGEREVRICIDELDKMDDESARRFLNELKVVFRVSDCFFFISISEEAMSFFERRGLHVRDVFDSSLDAVVHVPHIRFEVSRELIERRIAQLPLPFAALLHCLATGLPRDLIRAARDLVKLEQGTPLTEAARHLLGEGLEAKVEAAKTVSRLVEMEDSSFAMVGWIDRLARVEVNLESLWGICDEFHEDLLRELEPPARDAEMPTTRTELRALGVELAAYLYGAVTLLQFFAKFSDSEFSRAAIAAPSDDGPSYVDQLAVARQAFSSNLSTGWELLSAFRIEMGLGPTLPFPVIPPPGT